METSPPTANTQPKLVSQLGHSGSVISWAFSHDSNLVASSGSDKKIILWARASGRELWVVNYDSSFLAFSKDDQFLLVGRQRENELNITLLETASGKVAKNFQKVFKSPGSDETPPGEKYKLRSLKFSCGGKFIVATYPDNVLVLEASSMQEVWQSDISSVIAFSSDDALAVAANSDNLLCLFETLTWKERLTFPQDKRKIVSVAISKHGDFSLTGYEDGAVCFWTLATAGPVKKEIVPPGTSGQNRLVHSIEFSPNGDKFLVSHSPASTNRRELSSLRDTSTGQELFSFVGGNAKFSPQGNFVLTREYEGRGYYNTYVWNVSTGQKYWGFKVLSPKDDKEIVGRVSVYAFSSEDNYLLTEFADHDPAILWDLTNRKEAVRLVGMQSGMLRPVLSPDGHQILTGGSDGVAHLWDLDKGKKVASFQGSSWDSRTVAFSPDGTLILTGSGEIRAGDAIYLRNVRSEEERGSYGFSYPDNLKVQELRFPLLSMAISPDNRLLLGSYQRSVALWDVITKKEVWGSEENSIGNVAFSPDSRYFLVAKDDVKLYDAGSHQLLNKFSPGVVADSAAASVALVKAGFSPDGKLIFTLSGARLGEDGLTLQMFDRELKHQVFSLAGITDFSFTRDGKFVLSWTVGKAPKLWNIATKAEVPLPALPLQLASDNAFFHNGRFLLIELHDQTISLLDHSEGRELCRLVSVGGDTWLVVAPDGRFDTNSIEEIRGIHWIMPDDPLTPLSPEVFMRDYYEPNLLPRLLDGATFREVPSLASLNRVRPEVKVIAVRPEEGREDRVSVMVEVTEGVRSMPGKGVKTSVTSGAYDLRLLRDGQLVGYKPGNLPLGVSGKSTVEFEVRLPRRTDAGDIEFTAYAFNSDRVKSATAKSTYKPTHPLPAVKGRAYVISVGVSAYEDPTWDLSFAARDARVSEEVLTENLSATGEYEVVPLKLTSERGKTGADHLETSRLATRQNFQTVLDLLAHGPEKVDAKLFEEIPDAKKLRKAEPEDLVLINFSSHGYTDKHGKFYLIPYDTGSEIKFSPDGQEIAAESLSRFISSDDLSEWMRDIDAGELVVIVDTCHSASAVEEPGFKPGPMGSRGMGQLAYDKGMRLLAASQADDVALEVEKLQQGLLTYALMQDGLGQGKADKNGDGRITLDEWLGYGAERVPTLYDDVKAGRVSELKKKDLHITAVLSGSSVKKSAFQQPQLFDFKRKKREIVITAAR